MVSHFLFLGAEKRVGFGSPVGTKRWYFIKLLDCPVAENQGLRYLIVVHKRFLLNSHAGNTGSNPVGTTIKSITSICLFKTGSVLVSPIIVQAYWCCNVVVLLYELPEFRRNVLEVMRQPLEDGNNIVSRVLG